MRDIRFRAWDTAKNHMCFFGPDFDVDDDSYHLAFLTPEFMSPPIGDHNAMERYEIMQYTGLKDKNGVEIYEGDILQHPEATAPDVVEWGTLTRRNRMEKEHPAGVGFEIAGDSAEFEIIGNIYSNPELLKEGV